MSSSLSFTVYFLVARLLKSLSVTYICTQAKALWITHKANNLKNCLTFWVFQSFEELYVDTIAKTSYERTKANEISS